VIRPADAAETVEAWKVAIERREGPTALILSRQDLPVLDRDGLAPAGLLARGAYVLAGAQGWPEDLILLASGSEVSVALAAADLLRSDHGLSVRVVSMPSWELFERQDDAYRREILPPDIPVRLAVEAASPFGWSRWVGDAGGVVGVDRFGASAPGAVVLERYGFTAEKVTARALQLLRPNGSSVGGR
jgi:transketolase